MTKNLVREIISLNKKLAAKESQNKTLRIMWSDLDAAYKRQHKRIKALEEKLKNTK